MKKFLLEYLDKKIYNFLLKNREIIPKRFVKFIAYYYPDARIRKIYLEKLGVFMGKDTYANIGLVVLHGEEIKKKVMIGKNVSIASNVTFILESSANNGKKINNFKKIKDITKNKDIVIEDDVWIGAGVIFLPGVHIGKCSVIGAGSVVTKNIPEFSIVAGVPAKKIGDIKERS